MCPIERVQQEKARLAQMRKDLAAERASRVAARAAKACALPPHKKRTYTESDNDDESNYNRSQKKRKSDTSTATKRKFTDDYDEDDDFVVADSDDERPSKRNKKESAAAADDEEKPKKAKDEKPKPKNKHEKALSKFKNKMKTTNTLGGGLFAMRRENDAFLAGRRKAAEPQAMKHGATAEVKQRAQAIDAYRKQGLSQFGGLFGMAASPKKKVGKTDAQRKALALTEERKIAGMKAKRTQAMKEQEAEKAEQRRIQELEELQEEFDSAPVAPSATTEDPLPPTEQDDDFAYLFEDEKIEEPKPAPVAQLTAAEVVTPPCESTDESFAGVDTSTPKMSDDESSATSANSPPAVAPVAQMIQSEHYTPPTSSEVTPAKHYLAPQTSSRGRRRVAPTHISDATRKEVEGAS